MSLQNEVAALAGELGVMAEYVDASGTPRRAGHDAVLAMVSALTGREVRGESDARAVRAARASERAARGAPPVVVAWGGALNGVDVGAAAGRWRARIRSEDGSVAGASGRLGGGRIPVRADLALGYHTLELEWADRRAEVRIIAAPRRAPRGPRRGWGVFAPVYALRGARAAGCGTLAELGELMDFVQNEGGHFVATLPLLAQFLDRPFDTSPFAPASRLFWNELYLDVERLHGLGECAEARELLGSAAFTAELAALEAAPFMAAGRKVRLLHALLEPLARHFFASGGESSARFARFVQEQPYARDYALYRATLEAHPGPAAPDLRGQSLDASRAPAGRVAMHLFAQWQLHEQLAALTDRARRAGTRLYLDMPVGVHAASFDVWREPGCFVPGVSVGAPPDELCPEGQDWGFQPSHPEGQRAQAFRYFSAAARNQLRHAGILRIDHVAGLSRVFCVPHGFAARDGVYLRQPAEEQYAILALEAERAGSVLVGEDLGVVPAEVRASMREHGLKRTFVLPFELVQRGARRQVRAVPAESLAALNTHDMPSFAGMWRGHDIRSRRARGVLAPGAELGERRARRAQLAALREALGVPADASRDEVLRAAVRWLGESRAELVMVSLEDLWAELEPQNVPGTFDPERNFCRRMRHRVDRLPRLSAVRALLRVLAEAREGKTRRVSRSG